MALSKLVWKDGEIIKLKNAKINIFSPSVQYAHGGFEGIRFYDTKKGPAVFRLQDHWERFFADTAVELAMEIPYSAGDLTKAVVDLIRATGMREGYIRPCIVYPKPELGLRFKQREVSVAICLASWEKKLTEDGVTLTISPVIRNHPDSVNMRAKVSGYYQNSIRALRDAEQRGFGEALLLDYEGNIAEGSAENIFLVLRRPWTEEKALFTPPLGAILPGVTRDTIITLAREAGYEVRDDQKLKIRDLFASEEIFLCGTAMEILSVLEIDGHKVGNGEKGDVTSHLCHLYSDIVHGRDPRYTHWLTFVDA